MKVLIDFTQIPLQKVGVGVYALNLISRLHEIDRSNSYYIFVQDDDSSLDHLRRAGFTLVRVRARWFRKMIFRFFLEQFYIPYFAVRRGIDVIHSLHYSFPLLPCGASKVVTVCDMTFFRFPASHIPLKRYYFRSFIRLVALFADTVIAISRSTLDDFRAQFPSWKGKGVVVYLGRDSTFNAGISAGEREAAMEALRICGEYILFVGTIEPRKNVRNLILAFSILSREYPGLRLVIAGKKGWYYKEVFELVEELGLRGSVIFTGFIDEKIKPGLISGARLFVYPSIYEGFGIPVLEALSCGVPTVTSRVSSMPEVAGSAAEFADPYSPDDIYSVMKKVLSDEGLYRRMKKESVIQAAKFDWNSTARETIAVYSACL